MAHNAVLTWSAPDDVVSTSAYNVYRANGLCNVDGSLVGLTFSRLNSTAISALTYTDSTVQVAHSYCYYGTQVQNAIESLPSNTAGGTVLPHTVTIQLVLG